MNLIGTYKAKYPCGIWQQGIFLIPESLLF